MCEGMFESFAPANSPEKELVQLLCDTQWRLQRCGRLEAAILSADSPDFKALDIVSKHESRLKRQYSTTLKETGNLIDTRLTQQEADMKEASRIRRADQLKGGATDLKQLGFVFSTEQVDAFILGEDTLAQANKVLARDRVNKMNGYSTISDKKQGR